MKFVSIFIILFLFCSCVARIDKAAEAEKLMRLSRDWSRVAESGDIEKTLSYWSDSAVVISSGDPTIQGKDGIRKMVESSLRNPGFKIFWEPKKAEISESGDFGYLLEETTITITDSARKTISQHYNGITIWKRQDDGSWKNVVDVLSKKVD